MKPEQQQLLRCTRAHVRRISFHADDKGFAALLHDPFTLVGARRSRRGGHDEAAASLMLLPQLVTTLLNGVSAQDQWPCAHGRRSFRCCSHTEHEAILATCTCVFKYQSPQSRGHLGATAVIC